MSRRFVWSIAMVTVQALVGCRATGGGGFNNRNPKTGVHEHRPSLPPHHGKTTMAVPPMTFTLCAEGLPTAGMWKCDPVAADVNGDGNMDLVGLARLGKGPNVWLGNQKGVWTDSSEGLKEGGLSCGGGIAVRDVNRDGYPDLAIGDHCQGIFIYLGDGTGKWQMVVKGLHPEPAAGAHAEDYLGVEDLDAGDVNGDGFIDLVTIAMDQGGVNVYLGDGTGTGWQRQTETVLPVKGWGNRVTFHDLNKDGHLDLIAAMGEGPRIWMGDGKGGWALAAKGLVTPMTQGLFSGIAVGDVNNDGHLDLVFGNWIDGPEVFLQEADGSWKSTPDAFPDMLGGAVGVALGDIDQDKNLDLLVSGRLTTDSGYNYGLFVLKGDGHGKWQYLRDTNLPETGLSTAWGVSLADVNGDGVLDLLYGTGGKVATDLKRNAPVIATLFQVWCTQLTSADRAVLASVPSAK